ncbi:hypothetical protein CEY12_07785 [Chryseobacterium sp. T16E-39]|uniref:hypothetical protein n=1 Tax=Chryseobacterium sp. T16E-39 TaxID=2015076 RepID=UPI000B5B1862|nr:hypothetical protein [Chryseobacterium sp. T16E-39]ASK30014.1 hypothetical protein CEY12_07785 [Chryseobacterium sp. T16E-39]
MKLSNEDLALHDVMAQKLPELIEEYFKRPEITSVGVSLKTVNDELTNKLSYTFGVKKKLPISKVSHPIPATILGYPTDVIELEVQPNTLAEPNPVIEATRNEKTDPLIGGISISANGGLMHGGKEVRGNGTLGVMVNKKNDDNPYMMTCAHVLVGTTTKLDSDVCQQSKWETTFEYCHDCAALKSYYHENVYFQRGSSTINAWLDCAIARKGWFRNATIGKVYGVASVISGFAVINASIIGEEVRKSGITTDITVGEITSITTSLRLDNFDGTEVIGNNLTMIRARSGRFSNSGDSGSAIFTTNGSLLVGILGGSTASADLTFASPADAILSKWSDLTF